MSAQTKTEGDLTEVIGKLLCSLRRLDIAGHRSPRSRWLVRRGSDGPWRGPYEAVEIACLIYSGELDSADEVFHRKTLQTYVVGEEAFLSRWSTGSRKTERALLEGLSRSIERKVQRLERSAANEVPRRQRPLADLSLALQLLDVKEDTPIEEMKRRHRQLAWEHHPDRGGDPHRMQQINWAWGVAREAVAT